MKKALIVIFLHFVCVSLFAEQLHVVTTYPYIASIVEQIGAKNVRVHPLADGEWDPHTILPKPSFIAHLRRADLLIINGAQLEIGWLPPLMKQSNNPKISVGGQGLFDLSRFVQLIDIPVSVSRAHGDIHPDGNPHYYLDPHNIPLIAKAIMEKLCDLDPAGASDYRKNHALFINKWETRLTQWDKELVKLKGITVIEYHKIYDYFLRRYGIELLGTVETLPGIPPTSKHIEELETKLQTSTVQFILQDVYNPDEASLHLAHKHNIKCIKLPHDVGAVREAEDIFSLYDEIVRRLTNE